MLGAAGPSDGRLALAGRDNNATGLSKGSRTRFHV